MGRRSKKKNRGIATARAGLAQGVAEARAPDPSPKAHSAPVRERSVEKRTWLAGGALVALVFLVYQPVWKAGYLWDDDLVLTANPVIVGPFGLKEIWTTGAADICPFTLSTFWLEHKLWGTAPLPFHLVTVLFHAVGAVVFWRLLRALAVPGAWLGAAVWALHPVMVESVAWVAEMKNTESGVFVLLSLLFYVRAATAPPRRGWVGNYAASLIFAVLAMASKSSTVALPVVMALCGWWIERQWRWRSLAKVAPVLAMSIADALLSLWTQGQNDAHTDAGPRSWPERFVTAGQAVWFYLGKLAWPHPLSVVYPRWQPDPYRWTSYLSLLAIGTVFVILWLRRNSWGRSYFFAWTVFVVALAPVLGFADMTYHRHSFVADHFQYLAAMGPLALVGAGLGRLREKQPPWLAPVAAGALLLILGLLTWQRARVFRDGESLWRDNLIANPNSWVAYNNLGDDALENDSDPKKALELFSKALALQPNFAETRNNMGAALAQEGHYLEAIAEFRKALALLPRYQTAKNNLGMAYFNLGKTDEALTQFREALNMGVARLDIRMYIAVALTKAGKLDEAIAEYRKAVADYPNDAELHNNLGNALIHKHQVDEAQAEYRKAIALNPRFAEPHGNLAQVYSHVGRPADAITEFRTALKLDPHSKLAQCGLAVMLGQGGQLDAALAEYPKALQMNPKDAELRNDLGIVLAEKGRLAEAQAQFQEAIRLKPDYPDAETNFARAQALLRQKASPGSAQTSPGFGH